MADNVAAILNCAASRDEVAQQTDALLHDLHVHHLRNNPALSLSGGERRRVEIARALASTVLHPARRAFCRRRPHRRTRNPENHPLSSARDIGVLITDHNVRETLGICDHAYIINDGPVLACGKPDEIVYNETVRKVYLGEHFRL